MARLLSIRRRFRDSEGIIQEGENFRNLLVMDTQSWGISSNVESGKSRAFNKSTSRGFIVRRLPRSASTKIIKVIFFPRAVPPIAGRPWYAPIDILKDFQGFEVDLFMGMLNVGTWYLQNLTSSEMNYIGPAPQKIELTLNFLEIDRRWPSWR